MTQVKTIDFKNTLNLPKTDFPMKANLSQKEPEILEKWEEIDLYNKIREFSQGKPKFILHDGPPYANGHIHLGHCLNKILKDIIVKSKTMFSLDSYYVPGWDCHGLPIEYQVTKDLVPQKEGTTKAEIRKLCRRYAERFIEIQRDEFKRIGVFGDWDAPYLTMSYGYEATIARELGNFMENGGLYRGKKPVYWCYHCHTALAEAEVEYEDKTSQSIYVKFPLIDDKAVTKFPKLKDKDVFALIWTTTPWTLPANLALAFHPELNYLFAEMDGEVYIIAEDLAQGVLGAGFKVSDEIKGKSMEFVKFKHPFYDRESLATLADFVSLETGTGIVHIAPGHGQDDYELSKKYDLDVYAPVDSKGVFTKDVEFFNNIFVYDANPKIIDKLGELGRLFKNEEIQHSYPHCWRCKNPIIFRATPQWFISMSTNDLREKALGEIERVRWIPDWGKERISNMIENRPDWCVSRQRVWGVPIIVFYCDSCDYVLLDSEVVEHVAKIFAEKGSDVWFTESVCDLLPQGTRCPDCDSSEFRRETDILDVWFDSGVSFAVVLEGNPYLSMPADMYLEGSDQHRGWFHSSLLACVGTRGTAPYRSVLTHGFVVDKNGQKMSKSKGNVVAPSDIIKRYGAEVLRLWVAAEDYRADIRISTEILDRLIESYRKIRNTFRFMLGNLYDYNPLEHKVEYENLDETDKWVLNRLSVTSDKILNAYESYEFHIVYHELQRFCIVELSSVYLDFQKDVLYTFAQNSIKRRSAQTALYIILDSLTRLCAPVLSFTAEEVWHHMPGKAEESVYLTTFLRPDYKNDEIDNKWKRILPLRDEILKALEISRKDKFVRSSLEAGVGIYANGKIRDLITDNLDLLKAISIVSDMEILKEPPEGQEYTFKSSDIEGLVVDVHKARGMKCERCWTYRTTVGGNKDYPTVCHRCIDSLREMRVI